MQGNVCGFAGYFFLTPLAVPEEVHHLSHGNLNTAKPSLRFLWRSLLIIGLLNKVGNASASLSSLSPPLVSVSADATVPV